MRRRIGVVEVKMEADIVEMVGAVVGLVAGIEAIEATEMVGVMGGMQEEVGLVVVGVGTGGSKVAERIDIEMLVNPGMVSGGNKHCNSVSKFLSFLLFGILSLAAQ